MKIKFRGTLAALSETQAIQGRNGVVSKATAYIVPIQFDPTTGDPTYGQFADALPVDCMNEAINQVANLAAGTEVVVNAFLSGRTQTQPDNTVKSFLSLRLIGLQPVQSQQPTAQEEEQQPTPQPAQQPAGFAAPFQPTGGVRR